MASFGHVAVGLLAGRALKPNSSPRPAAGPMLVCAALALLPDLDYLGVMLGVPNVGPCGHRGASHSLLPPLLIALLGAALAHRFRLPRWRTALAFGLAVASHPLLDAMTTGGRGIPLFWPVSFHRFEIPWQPIPDAPCGLAYLSLAGLRVASIEFFQFLPVLLLAFRPPRPATATGQETAARSLVRQGNAAPGRASITRQAI